MLKECFPLCVGTTLAIYVSNASKYMIDYYMDERTQAIFGYIMLPAFAVLMLSNFIYQPIVRKFGEMWSDHNTDEFIKQIIFQYLIIFIITVISILTGVVVGLPILSLLYNVNLMPYKIEFIILLIGTGMYAVSSFLMIPLTTIRSQTAIAIGFLMVTVASFIFGNYFVKHYGMMGASVLYFILNLILSIFLMRYFWWKLKILNEKY